MDRLLSPFILLLLVLSGCHSQPNPTTPPSWILNPNKDGRNGAVGSAMRTYDQKTSTQRKLAITRALDELSLQQGVKVEMNLTKHESYNNSRMNTKMDVDSKYKTNNTITAHIEDVYKDKNSGELFIWMVMN